MPYPCPLSSLFFIFGYPRPKFRFFFAIAPRPSPNPPVLPHAVRLIPCHKFDTQCERSIRSWRALWQSWCDISKTVSFFLTISTFGKTDLALTTSRRCAPLSTYTICQPSNATLAGGLQVHELINLTTQKHHSCGLHIPRNKSIA